MRRKTKRILVITGLVVSVLVLSYVLALVQSTARRRRAYAALEAAGRPMHAADVIPPEVSDADNAAPLFAAAALPFKAQPFGLGHGTMLDRLGRLARRFYEESLDDEDLDYFKTQLAQEDAVQALRLFQEASQRPTCRYNRDYQNGVMADMSEAGDLRHLVRIWWAHSLMSTEGASPPPQERRIAMYLKLADLLRDDPSLASQRVRCSLIRGVCHIIQTECQERIPAPETIQRAQASLDDLEDVSPLLQAVDAERLLHGERFFNLSQNDLYETLRNDELLGGGMGPLFRPFFAFVKFKPRLVGDHATYLELMHQGVRLLAEPYGPAARQQYRTLARSATLTGEIAPMIEFDKRLYCRTVAQVRMTRAGLSLIAYRAEHGAFPEGLSALTPLDVNDPFSSGALLCRADGTAFSLYSVGENQQDNGGQPYDRDHKENDDIAWHLPPLSLREDVAVAGGEL